MIRFCDREVNCILYEQFDRSELLKYFFQGNMDEIVCVINSDGTYKGRVTYYSLINSKNPAEAVLEDYVILDDDIWDNARRFFAYYEYSLREHVLLPVLSQTGRLISFAFDDGEANREIRMLKELEEQPRALQFKDVFPQYTCVKICGFHELAYFFAEYLRKQNISVWTEGEFWKGFFEGDEEEWLDYQRLTIYAEGTGEGAKENWVENLLRSASPEFECIDCIYEANIKAGIITNAMGDLSALEEYLSGTEKEIVIWGTDIKAQNAYDYLLSRGIEAAYFASSDYEERDRLLFGKKVISLLEMRKRHDVIILSSHTKNSAFMGTDYYDYLGFRRNKDIFLLRDYMEIPHNNLKRALADKKILFVGDIYLCERVAGYLLEHTDVKEMIYADVFHQKAEYGENGILRKSDITNVGEDFVCLIVMPQIFLYKEGNTYTKKRKEIIGLLKEKGILNYTDYFSKTSSLVEMEKQLENKYRRRQLKPRKLIFGSIEERCGNSFIKGLLDNHPSILMMSDFSFFNNNLFWYCLRLANLPSEKVLSAFREMYRLESDTDLIDWSAFEEKLEELLGEKERYTSQELFIIFLISYVRMYGRTTEEINNMVVYWEPHSVKREEVEEYAGWLKEEDGSCGILNLVRNICAMNGSLLKYEYGCYGKVLSVANHLSYPNIRKKDDKGCERYIVQFENLKLHPQETLSKLCQKWGIPWSETLMETTAYGERLSFDNGESQIRDFDPAPVFNNYESYLSEFDRFRLTLICAPYQRKYGYPYVRPSFFTRKELQELFIKEFRFESKLSYNGEKAKLDAKIRTQEKIRLMLWEARMTEALDD